VEGSFDLFAMGCGDGEEGGDGVAKKRPSRRAKGEEDVEGWKLACRGEFRGEEAGFGAGVEVKQMVANGNAKVLLAVSCKSSVGQMGEGKIGGGIVGFGKPALK
jgi:hypothetical protein